MDIRPKKPQVFSVSQQLNPLMFFPCELKSSIWANTSRNTPIWSDKHI